MSGKHEPVRWNTIELKIIEKLENGAVVPRRDMIKFIQEEHDSESTGKNLNMIIFRLRRKMEKGMPHLVITCETKGRKLVYRMRRTL